MAESTAAAPRLPFQEMFGSYLSVYGWRGYMYVGSTGEY